MKRKRHMEDRMIAILKKYEAEVRTIDLCRKHRISDAAFYNSEAKYRGTEVSEAKRLGGLEGWNARCYAAAAGAGQASTDCACSTRRA